MAEIITSSDIVAAKTVDEGIVRVQITGWANLNLTLNAAEKLATEVAVAAARGRVESSRG